MLFDGLLYDDYARRASDIRLSRIRPLIGFFENRLGVSVLYPDRAGLGQPELAQAAETAARLIKSGIIRYVRPGPTLSDEPRFKSWLAKSRDTEDLNSGGASAEDDGPALLAALAESLERHLWLTQKDYFLKPIRARTGEMRRYGAYVSPERFAGFSADDRAKHPERRLDPDASYLWIQGVSLVSGKPTYIPAQTASGAVNTVEYPAEPLIRHQNTNGIATWPTLSGARLGGALEVIEREAYMVMWLNQLTVPKIPITALSGKSPSLDRLIERCTRYRLKIHALRMPTDAPTHAVCVVLEDESGQAPRFALGLKAHRSLTYTIEKAMLEALRARRVYRMHFLDGKPWDTATPVDKISRGERLFYWGDPANAPRLEFLIAGKESQYHEPAWENDTVEEHLSRISAWCRENAFECVSVSMGASAANPTQWHVEMVVMPELQPTYLLERMRELGGKRRINLPERLGYAARQQAYTDAPHPYS
jgi:ribosomal protein S12 methylthiotransferase accessory factor